MSCFRTLINDLEQMDSKSLKKPEKVEISKYGFDKVDKIIKAKELINKTKEFIGSEDGIKACKNEVLKMYKDLDICQGEFVKRNIDATIQKNNNTFTYIFRAEGYSFIIKLQIDKLRTSYENKLLVEFWNGNVYFGRNRKPLVSGNPPRRESLQEYSFDRIPDQSFAWYSIKTKDHRTSVQIIEMCTKWMISKVPMYQKRT